MGIAKWKRISAEEARALKPKRLPSIEPELKAPSPRPMIWVPRHPVFAKIYPKDEELLVNGRATRAWMTHYHSETDREGTDHYAQYAYIVGKKVFQDRYSTGFDDIHLAYGAPDYARWLYKHFTEGGTFTVLYDREDPRKNTIYGHLQLFFPRTLKELAKEARKCKDEKRYAFLCGKFLSIAVSPLGVMGGEYNRYFPAMAKLGLGTKSKVHDYKKNIENVKALLRSRKMDEKALETLSAICNKYRPGIWAAD